MNINEGWGPEPSTGGTAESVASLSWQRRRVFDLLGEQPLSVSEVARLLEVHVNTAREHLDGLVESGLAERTRRPPRGRGRPGWGYSLDPHAGDRAPGEYAALAGVLADFVSEQSDDVTGDMTRLGRGWGRRLMKARMSGAPQEVAGPSGTVTEAEADSSAIALLGDLGFAPSTPETTPDSTSAARSGAARGTTPHPQRPIRLLECPMLEVARERPDVVCAVHQGLVEGALAERGASADGVRLDAFAARDACLLHLR